MFGTYRTLLALMVVALHLGGIAAIGAYAVFGFYILSGYLMTLIMQTNYGYTLSGIFRYATNRFLRIYPMYWVSILFSTILIIFVGEQFSSDYHSSIYLPHELSEIIKNIFIFFPFRDSPRLTPPAWALTVEIFYYILIGLGFSKNKYMVLFWLALSVIYHVSISILGIGWQHRYFTIPAASLPFSTGAFIYHYKHEMLERVNWVKGKAQDYLPYIIFSVILLNWYYGYITENSFGVLFYSNYILCATMVTILSERKTLPYITKKFDKWMGDFSYPIYLIHYQVGLIVLVALAKFGINCPHPSIMLMSISIPLIFLLSWIFTVSIEKPIELLRAKVKIANKPYGKDKKMSKN